MLLSKKLITMSRKSESDLFDLIKSLTKSEKKTITLYFRTHSIGYKDYVLLFEKMNSQSDYNEEEIIQFLKSKKVKSPLSKLKNYLQSVILKSLRFYYDDEPTDNKIQTLILEADIFHNKGLIRLRNRKINNAKSIATQFQKNEWLLVVLDKQWKYQIDYQPPNEIIYESNQVIQKIQLKNKYRQLFQYSYELYKKGSIRNQEIKVEWEELMKNSLLSEFNKPSGIEEKYYYQNIYIAYLGRFNQISKARDFIENAVIELELQPDLIKESPSFYFSLISNEIAILCSTKEIEKAKKNLHKLIFMKEQKLNKVENTKIMKYISSSFRNIIYYYFDLKLIREAKQIVMDAEEFLKLSTSDNPYYQGLLLRVSIFYFYFENYKKALEFNQKILNMENANNRINNYDQISLAKIIHLIIHFELGNEEYLTYYLLSTYRFLYKTKRLYKTESLVLISMKKLVKSTSKIEMIGVFKEFMDKIREITNNSFEFKLIEEFDFTLWIESKIENKSFADIWDSKYKKDIRY